MLTCTNAVAGGRSAIYAIIINLPVVALFMAMGLLLWIFFQAPALMGAAAPAYQPGSLRAFLAFILHEMPPGLAGLMMAGLFAIALTSLLSAINAMASAFVTDCYRHAVRGRPDAHYLFVSRAAVVGAGLVLGLMAVVCIEWQRASGLNLLGFAFNVMVLTSSGLLGVFLAAVFTARGTWWSAIAALAAAFVVALFLQPNLVTLWMPDCCPATWSKLAWPWRMVIGTAVSFGVCCLVPSPAAGKTDGPG
jgi:SSS family solute:Na+ symporter